MGTTAGYGLRYPEPTDKVADGALAIRNLAEDVDADLAAEVTRANAAYLAKDGLYSSLVATSESTTSTAFTDLATVGPSTDLTVGSSGRVLVILSAQMSNNTAGGLCQMGLALTGANTVAVGDGGTQQLTFDSATAGQRHGASRAFLLSGLAAGLTTFRAKYAVSTGTGTFLRRELIVIPL